jgi:enoyl-CoA hydratase/carnithine racemase/3-hydroxyacyl-CoA dehydrogenase
MPVKTSDLVDRIFGPPGRRGSLVISGVNGIVGAGKAMQLCSRLESFDIPVIGLDFPGSPDGLGKQFQGLLSAFGHEKANSIMAQIRRMSYDGRRLPPGLADLKPRFLLEAIPEVLEIKKAHYAIFREKFPEIEIRSVTSGFPASELGVGIAHPAFPHEINKIWEVVEKEPSPITHMFWALGLIPVPVSDHWSFVLDVLFCGLTLAGTRYCRASNMPYWKADKYIRKSLGPNPFRAHDVIGAAGANFLTWSCLFHLSRKYGDLFTPTPELDERKVSGQNWYPLDHFRPLVDWSLSESEEQEMEHWIKGALFQMTSLLLEEKRAHLSHINAIGELCAQFRRGVLALLRSAGPGNAVKTVEAYHRLHPEAAGSCWYPDVFSHMEEPQWQQLYVNAEHDGSTGVITIGRESYNSDVDRELNRAIDWLKAEGIEHVIVTGDFHLATQMVGADTSEFFPALEHQDEGLRISGSWSLTARRLHREFKVSVGFINGKRCLGGFLELLTHCHYLVAVDDASLGMPEVTLPVVPGMEGCHWPFRKADPKDWPRLLHLLLEGKPLRARDAAGWLIDYAGTVDDALRTAWAIVTGGEHNIAQRTLNEGILEGIPVADLKLPAADEPGTEAGREAIVEAIKASCGSTLEEAVTVQARHSAAFMTTSDCRKGRIGAEYGRIKVV